LKTWWGIAFGVVVGLLAAGLILLVGSPPRGEAIRLSPLPSPPPLVVDVDGAVVKPGVYSLPAGSRVVDAVEAAGGFLPGAEEQAVNLAAPLTDGAWVKIPAENQDAILTPKLPSSVVVSASPSPTFTKRLIDINTATQEELEWLPGIGPVLSRRIIAYRTAYGPFVTVEDILTVYGISPETFELIRDLITVGEAP